MKKQLLQKQRGIFIALLSFLCVMSIQAQTWTAPVPVGSVITTASQYYVYSVGAKAFLDRGGDWDSQAIVTPYGAVITTAQNGLLWNLEFENNIAKCLKYDFPIANGMMFTDGAVRNNLNVQLTDVANNVYSIQLPDSSIAYNASQFIGTSSTIYSSNREGTVYDVRFNRTTSDHTKWMFVTATDLATYNAKVELDKYMNIAKLVGSSVDLTSYISTYNAGVTADINTAVTNLKAALTVVDKTSSINNADFSSAPTTGWTVSTNYGWSNSVCEFWHQNNKSLSQTITGLTPGVYMVKAQGFQRQRGLTTAERTNFTNGSDVLCDKLYVTASGTTTFIPLKSIYSETTCPAGTTVDALKFPNSTADARAAFDLGLYENELGYVTVDGTGSLTLGTNTYYQSNGVGDWQVVDNFRLYYYGALGVPVLSTSTSSISFAGTKSASFSVTGLNQSSAVTLTAPAGITLSTYSIPANPSAVSVDVTYDGSTTVADTIRLSCGALVAKIAVSAHPTLTTSTSSIGFEGTTSSSFTVSSSQTNAVTLTAPAGITLSTYSIPASPTAVSVDVTYDGTTSLADTIRLSCGSLVAKVAVKSYNCFTPLFPSGNLVTDPQCTNIATYKNWGTTAIITGANAYCGSSVQATGSACAGSIDHTFSGILANTTYRLRVMMYSNGNAGITLNGCGINGSSADFSHPVSTGSTWQLVDFTFTTGTLGASQNFWFNSCAGGTATDIRMDNFEMYQVPGIRVAEASVPVMSSAVGSSDSKTIKVSGNGLTAGVSLVLSGANADQFSVSPAILPIVAADSIATTLVSITYTPTGAAMSHVATLTLSSLGAADKTFELSASSSATGVSQVSSDASVSVSNGMLKVNGSLSYEIFTAQGMRVAQSKANGESYSVALKPGVYIIKLDNGVKKVVVK